MSGKILEKTDQELVALALADQKDFLFLVKRYQNQLIQYICRISNVAKEDAEDILQEVFLKVYRNLNSYNPKLKFSSWIYRITHNEVISAYRKKKNRPQTIDLDLDFNLIETLADDFDIKEKIDQNFLKEKISQVLLKMDHKYAEVLVLYYFEQKDYQEISDIIKKPKGTVATYLNRAKKQFNKILTKENIKFH